ncbi:MAG TPA: hypothetical protein VFW00_13475 [Rhodocyclaceae bacterium]|nr:hypothetical protein [Rhodocyclaceae bacterium]
MSTHSLVESDAGSSVSGVSWGAIFAGAAGAAALSLILLILGVGLGLSSVSPWSYDASPIGASTIIWLAFTQLVASGVGGYLAGRLRVKWIDVHADEVYFRDTAHGLLAWAVASLVTATLLAGAAGAVLGKVVDAGASMAASAVATGAASNGPRNAPNIAANPVDYFSDMLLRSSVATPNATTSDANNDAARGEVNRNEVSRILITDIRAGTLPAEDRTYLANMIATRTGMNEADAERRVDDVYARATKTINDAQTTAKQAADDARKAAAHSALWMFVALLLGAFVASLAATFGGRLRDSTRVRS